MSERSLCSCSDYLHRCSGKVIHSLRNLIATVVVQIAMQAAQLLAADDRIAQLEEELLAERAKAAGLERTLQSSQQERARSQQLADTLQACSIHSSCRVSYVTLCNRC